MGNHNPDFFNNSVLFVERGITLGKRVMKNQTPPRALRWFLFAAGSLCMGLAAAVASQWIITGSLANGVLPWFVETPATCC